MALDCRGANSPIDSAVAWSAAASLATTATIVNSSVASGCLPCCCQCLHLHCWPHHSCCCLPCESSLLESVWCRFSLKHLTLVMTVACLMWLIKFYSSILSHILEKLVSQWEGRDLGINLKTEPSIFLISYQGLPGASEFVIHVAIR